jgi:ActR/RegA family two-component response regulator
MAYENADRSRVLDRVTEILNLCVPGGYTSTLSPRNKTRNEDAIADFVDEAGLMILKAMAERPNEFRYLLLTDTSAITTSGNAVPLVNDQPHLGPPAAVKDNPVFRRNGARKRRT